jgi:ADP-ribosyl-[dinitrogen reductase] hydrolase
MQALENLLSAVVPIVEFAAGLLQNERRREGGPKGEGDKAQIDIVIEEFLRENLLKLHHATFRGEETGSVLGGIDGDIWLVDPHDGTRAFLEGYDGSAISVALLRRSIPVLGVVCAPSSPDRGFDCIAWAEGCTSIVRNGRKVRKRCSVHGLTSRSIVFLNHRSSENPLSNGAAVAPARFVSLPSIAYRLARVAAGDGIAAVSLNGPSSLDYAAGHALLRGAGGVLIDQSGAEVIYSPEGYSNVRACFGGSPAAVRQLVAQSWSIQSWDYRKSLQAPNIKGYALDEGEVDRAKGCLLGQVIGDSLGSLVEFRSAESIQRIYPRGVRYLADGGIWKTLAGQPTDDSELALALARSLAALGRYDEEKIAEAYGQWFNSAPFDIGTTTAQALKAVAYSKDDRISAAWHAASHDSQSNGSLMRISPIGIWAGYPKVAECFAGLDSRLTHPNQACVEACQVFAAAVASGVKTGRVDSMISDAQFHAKNCFSEVIREALANAINGIGPDAVDGKYQGWVVIAFQNAFRHLAKKTKFEKALVETVGMGGDTDTNAAITGALLGSCYGMKSIPSRWVLPVLSCRPLKELNVPNPRPEEYWPDDILQLAVQLLLSRERINEPFDDDV